MQAFKTRKLFSLGQIVITPEARNQLEPEDVALSLVRHSRGDWGDCAKEDAKENELSLKEGFRLLSVYHDRNLNKFWILTEADRSITTILLPEQY